MTVETRLKALITDKFGTMKDFSEHIGIPNSTLANIMRRGVNNANVLTIIKICQALGISTDDLAEGRIVPITRSTATSSAVEDIFGHAIQDLLNSDCLTLDGQLLTDAQIRSLIISLDMVLESEKKRMMTK